MARRFDTLDGLRGLAALVVMIFHFGMWTERRWMAPHGYLAVDFFFALSGFVVAHAYSERLRTMGWLGFMAARVRRLWPMLALGMLLGAVNVFIANGPAGLPAKVLAGLFLIPNLTTRESYPFPLDPMAWSLFFEIAANAVWAVVALRIRALGLAAAIVAAGLAMIFIGEAGLTGHPGVLDMGSEPFWAGFPRVAFSYTIGLLCYRVVASGRNIAAQPWPIPALALLGLLVIPRTSTLIDVALIATAVPVILLAGAAARSAGRIARVSGDLSYPLYLLHAPIYFLLLAGYQAAGGSFVFAWMLPIVGGVSMAVSWAALKFYDEPFRAWLAARARPVALATD